MVRGEWWQLGWTRRRLSGVFRLQRQCMTILMLANTVLVEQGADLDRRDGEGWTALMFSVEGMGKVVRLLVDKGAYSKM